MDTTYTTTQGDCWDAIAYAVYGDTVYTGELMQANQDYLDVFVFGAGVVLQVPALAESTTETLPTWRA